MSPCLPIRTSWDLGVGGVIYPFCTYFYEFFQIVYNFFGFRGCLCLFGWLLIPICLVAILYMSRICMIGYLSIVYFSTFHDNSTSHVHCCSYLVHLNIDLWCSYFEIWFEGVLLGHSTSVFHSKKNREKLREKKLNSCTSICALNKCNAHPKKNPNKERSLNVC